MKQNGYGLLAILVFLSLGGEARAWGDLGHRVICEIAYRVVQPGTREEIDRLIRLDQQFPTFADSCIYPDHPRIRAPEHFINLPRDSKGLTSDECPQADTCVLTAIRQDTQVLASRSAPDEVRSVVLKSLGHWVGDIHQPLHVSFLDDLGGNKITVSGQCKGRLHATWDTCLVHYAVGPIATEAATDLLAAITPDMQSQWSASKPLDWANETFSITRAALTQYCVIRDSSCDSGAGNIVIGDTYLNANEPIVKQQLQRAGVRLARLLDDALAK